MPPTHSRARESHPKPALALAPMSQPTPLEPLIEFDLLNKYMTARCAAWRHSGHLSWLLHASVQAGERSPLRAAEWAQNQTIGHRARILRTLNLAEDEQTLEDLERDLSPFSSVASNLSGSLESSLERVIQTIGVDPAFVLLDPLRDGGVCIESLARLLSRRGRQTELLVHLDNDSLEELRRSSTREHIDEVIGTSLWRTLCESTSPERSLTSVAALYRASLQRRGFSFAREIPPCRDSSWRNSSRVLFASRSRLSVALMSDLVCRYRRAHEDPPTRDIRELSDRIYELGGRLQSVSTDRLMQSLSPQLFGEFQNTDYRKAVRGLVQRGAIARSDHSGIDDEETLTFNGAPQMALFDGAALAANAAGD
jgi:three-Cys-motif partner protein